jgi:uncharacterized coiled-coil DUF342 family protein
MTETLEKLNELEAKKQDKITKTIQQGLNPKESRKRTRVDDKEYYEQRDTMIQAVRAVTEKGKGWNLN